MFDLQLHGVQGLEGIPEDIQKEILGEMEPGGDNDPKEEQKKEEEPKETKVEEVHADADSDNKQVEPETKDDADKGEEKDAAESDTIPYKRFKSVNEKRKALMTENEELKRKIEELTKTSSKEKPIERKSEVPQYEGFSQEQMEKIHDYAIRQIKEADKLSDEDIEAIKYSDDKIKSMAFERRVADEVSKAIEGLRDIQRKKNDLNRQWEESNREFSELNERITGREDGEELIKYLTVTAFAKETQRRQRCIQESLTRLQAKKGTYHDIELIASYVSKAEAAYDKEHQKAASVAQKFEKAQGLPKAPNVNGGASSDKTYTIDDIRAALESGDPKAWESIPKDIRDKIMRGEPI